ncbi:MAG: D-Ala-D-Ala carboxypeptidase family metallohydrolase [Thermoanaerobaculia bacterium]|nr:D-Ala-D-Ala carboxypeptidase family metallohydrolase [Thermoanaerobaculia bacterium]
MNSIALAMMFGALLMGLDSLPTALPEPPVALALLAETPEVDGERIRLESLPGFTTRLFVPVVAGSLNAFSIADEPIVGIVESPAGFSLSIVSDGLVVHAEQSDAWGYATVETAERVLVLTLFAMTPATSVRDGMLDGYQIGEYIKTPLKGLETYAPPRGFIRLTPENADARVSDRYSLRDFQCKLDGGSKFLVLRPEALIKLELMQHKLAKRSRAGFEKFTIMSGFRTPFYNSRIGNETGYSRHLYGDAMDIYVDSDGDGRMDDLNRDGRVNQRDAALLLAVAEEIDDSADWGWLKGGAGVYRANKAHGPFLHVDTRGYVARWGIVR